MRFDTHEEELTVFSSCCGSVIFTLFSLMMFDSIGVAIGVVVAGVVLEGLGVSVCTVVMLVVPEGLAVAVSLCMVCV